MTYYTWKQCKDDIKQLISTIPQNYNCIVGISRGGVFVAGLIAEVTGIKDLYLLRYNSYDFKEKSKIVKQIGSINPDLRNRKILLVDDISDTGDTLKRAYLDLSSLNNKVSIMTLYYKKTTSMMPDFFIHETTDWIVFPWEYNNESK